LKDGMNSRLTASVAVLAFSSVAALSPAWTITTATADTCGEVKQPPGLECAFFAAFLSHDAPSEIVFVVEHRSNAALVVRLDKRPDYASHSAAR
jgi:hypothetical protein